MARQALICTCRTRLSSSATRMGNGLKLTAALVLTALSGRGIQAAIRACVQEVCHNQAILCPDTVDFPEKENTARVTTRRAFRSLLADDGSPPRTSFSMKRGPRSMPCSENIAQAGCTTQLLTQLYLTAMLQLCNDSDQRLSCPRWGPPEPIPRDLSLQDLLNSQRRETHSVGSLLMLGGRIWADSGCCAFPQNGRLARLISLSGRVTLECQNTHDSKNQGYS